MHAGRLAENGVSIERLAKSHFAAIGNFDCGKADENNYLKNSAFPNQTGHLSETFLLFENDSRHLISYATLLFGSFKLASDREIGGVKIKRKPFWVHANNLPCLQIGKLATDKNETKRGGASLLLSFAIRKALEVDRVLALPYLSLDAYMDKIGFYQKNGFKIAYEPKKNDRTAALYLQIF